MVSDEYLASVKVLDELKVKFASSPLTLEDTDDKTLVDYGRPYVPDRHKYAADRILKKAIDDFRCFLTNAKAGKVSW